MEFARQLQATVDPAIKDRDQRMYEAKEKALADGVVSRNAWEKAPLTASSDRKVHFTQQKSLQQQHMTCIHGRNCEKKFRTNSMRRTENHMHRCMRVNKNKKK